MEEAGEGAAGWTGAYDGYFEVDGMVVRSRAVLRCDDDDINQR